MMHQSDYFMTLVTRLKKSPMLSNMYTIAIQQPNRYITIPSVAMSKRLYGVGWCWITWIYVLVPSTHSAIIPRSPFRIQTFSWRSLDASVFGGWLGWMAVCVCRFALVCVCVCFCVRLCMCMCVCVRIEQMEYTSQINHPFIPGITSSSPAKSQYSTPLRKIDRFIYRHGSYGIHQLEHQWKRWIVFCGWKEGFFEGGKWGGKPERAGTFQWDGCEDDGDGLVGVAWLPRLSVL